MTITRFSGPILFLFTALVSAACASGENIVIKKAPDPAQETSSTTGTVTSASSFCSSLCERQETCDTGLDTQTCKNTCTNSFAAVFPKLRQDVVSLIVDCFDAKDCKSVLEGNVVATCADEAVASVAPSAQASAYCDGLAAAKKKCGETTSKATCLDQAKLFSDEAITEAANCSERPCGEIDTCVSAAFGSLGGSTTSTPSQPSPSSKCAGKFSDLGSCSSCAETSCCDYANACAQDIYCRSVMARCQESSGYGYSSCSSYMSSMPSSSQSLLSSYFSCAASSCGSSCGFASY